MFTTTERLVLYCDIHGKASTDKNIYRFKPSSESARFPSIRSIRQLISFSGSIYVKAVSLYLQLHNRNTETLISTISVHDNSVAAGRQKLSVSWQEK